MIFPCVFLVERNACVKPNCYSCNELTITSVIALPPSLLLKPLVDPKINSSMSV